MWVFIAAAEEGSFTEGARRSNISQPAAVSIISEIEETVGEPLFERAGKTRRATLTARGKDVYDTFVRTLSVYERALESICASKRQRPAQKILIQTPYAASVSAIWLHDMVSHEADAQLSIRSAGWREIVAAVEKREDCMALIDGDVRLRSSEYISIGNVEMVFVIPETSALFDMEANEIMWEDVPTNTVIYSDICPTALERTYENLKAAQGVSNTFMEVNCAAILRNFCETAGAPAIVPRNMIDAFDTDSTFKFRCLTFAHSKLFIPLGLLISHGSRMRVKVAGRNVENVFDRRFYI